MLQNVAVLGSSGHAKTVLSTLIAEGKYTPCGLISGDKSQLGKKIFDCYEIIGVLDDLGSAIKEYSLEGVIIGMGVPFSRESVFERVHAEFPQLSFITTVHPSAVVEEGATVGAGIYVGPTARIGPDAQVSDFSLVLSGAIIGHDSKIGEYGNILIGAVLAGDVTVGKYSQIGAGAVIRQGAQIGSNVVVGMGAVVTTHVDSDLVVIGNPAHYLRSRKPGETTFPAITKTIKKPS